MSDDFFKTKKTLIKGGNKINVRRLMRDFKDLLTSSEVYNVEELQNNQERQGMQRERDGAVPRVPRAKDCANLWLLIFLKTDEFMS